MFVVSWSLFNINYVWMCAAALLADIISWMMGLLFIIYINAGSEAGCTRAVTMVKTHIDH